MKLYREKLKKLRNILFSIKLSVGKTAALIFLTGTGLISCKNPCLADEIFYQETTNGLSINESEDHVSLPVSEEDVKDNEPADNEEKNENAEATGYSNTEEAENKQSPDTNEKLSIQVSRTDGLVPLIDAGAVYYTNSDLIFSLNEELRNGERLEYIVFCDNEDEGAYVPLETGEYYYDISGASQGVNYNICFRSVYEVNRETEVYDEEGNISEVKYVNCTSVRKSEVFSICADNTPPLISLENEFMLDAWYKNDINLGMEILDVSGISSVSVKAAGCEKVNESYYGNEALRYVYHNLFLCEQAGDENGQLLEITACDRAGNRAYYQKRYYLDKVSPKLELIHSDETVYNNSVFIETSFSDNIVQGAQVYYRAERENGNTYEEIENSVLSLSSSLGKVKREYFENGRYHIEVYSEDAAGNKTEPRVFDFIIDTICPEIEIKGVSDKGKYNSARSCSLIINESNYEDMRVSVVGDIDNLKMPKRIIYDDYYQDETRGYKEYFFSDNGRYELNISAVDAAGNESTKSIRFTIDDTSPSVIVENDIDKKVLSSFPVVKFTVSENLYDTAIMSTELYRRDTASLTRVPTDKYKLFAESTDISIPVKEEGQYLLRISVEDEAKNKVIREIEFSVDVTPPVIEYINKLDRKYFKRFKVPSDFSKYISDSSKVTFRAFMNSDEIDRAYRISGNGRYSLLIEAEDEAGNKSVEKANFIIDSKKPEVIIEGLRKDGTAKKNESLKVSLYDEKDILKEVTYMGSRVNVSDENCAEIVPSKIGTGILHVEAADRAGNELSEDFTITCSAIGGLDGTYISRSMTFIKEKLNNIWLQYNMLFKK